MVPDTLGQVVSGGNIVPERRAGRDGGGARSGRGLWSRTATWLLGGGALGLVLIVLQLMQAPQTVASFHEWMCGSKFLRGAAGVFGDCAGYAQKPTQVVISGSPFPQTKDHRYQLDYLRFWEGVRDNDTAALNKLHAEGWRIKAPDACRLLQYGPPPVPGESYGTKITVEMAKPLAASVVRFSSEKLTCGGRDVAVELLSGLAASQCFRSLDISTSPQVAIIDALASAKPSPDLRERAGKMLKAYQAAATSTRDALASLCIKRYGKGRSTSLPREEVDFLELVFRFSTSCNAPAPGLFLGFDPFSYTRDESEIAGLCRAYVKQGGIDPKAISFKGYLERWAK